MPKKVRYIYGVIILLLLVAVGFSLWQNKKANDEFNAEKSGLEQIWADHAKKVETEKQNSGNLKSTETK